MAGQRASTGKIQISTYLRQSYSVRVPRAINSRLTTVNSAISLLLGPSGTAATAPAATAGGGPAAGTAAVPPAGPRLLLGAGDGAGLVGLVFRSGINVSFGNGLAAETSATGTKNSSERGQTAHKHTA